MPYVTAHGAVGSLRATTGTAHINVTPRAETIVTTQRATAMITELASLSAETHTVVVADEISRGARHLLAEAGVGWLDRRGNVRIWSPPLMIDTAVPAQTRAARTVHSTDAIKGRGGLAYAVELLLAPENPPTLSAVARRAGLALSSVSEGASVVRDAGLVRSDGRPLIPELFTAVAEAWRPTWSWLAQAPAPNDDSRTGPLGLGLGLGLDDMSEPGWALTESRAAIGWGAPLVASGAYPAALYVPEPRTQRRALDLYGEGTPSQTRGARVAIAPLPVVCRPRYEVPGETWPGTNPSSSPWTSHRIQPAARKRSGPGNRRRRSSGSGSHVEPTILIVDEASPVVAFVEALGSLASEGMPRSAVVGGVGVMCQLAAAHRPTADIDALVRHDVVPSAVEVLIADGATRRRQHCRRRSRTPTRSVIVAPTSAVTSVAATTDPTSRVPRR